MAARLLLALLLLTTLLRADDELGWSKSVDGLRARLVIPANEARGLDPAVWVYLEIQNTLDVVGNRKIFYTPSCLALQVADETGLAAPPALIANDPDTSDGSPLIMPFDSTIRFRINLHATSIPGSPRLVLDLPGATAIIPTADTHTYFISGTLTIKHQKDNPAMAWEGTLELPRVQVPAQ